VISGGARVHHGLRPVPRKQRAKSSSGGGNLVSPQTVEKCGCGFDSLPEYERGAQKEALRRKRKKEREKTGSGGIQKDGGRARRQNSWTQQRRQRRRWKRVRLLCLWARAPLGAGLNALAHSFEQRRVIEMEPMERHIARALH